MGFLETVFKIIQAVFCSDQSRPPQQQQPPQGYPAQQPHTQQPGWQQQPSTYPPQPQHPQYPQHPQQPQQPHKPQQPQQPHKPTHDSNQVNQNNDHYVSLRAKANAEGDAMARFFDESHQAYARGDGAAAKDLSNKGKAHKAEMEKLNGQASDWIFRENNKDSPPDTIDLHGLYVKEAIDHTERALQQAQQRGDQHLRVIVGKGLHSQSHVAKIKPAIEQLMQQYQIEAEMDPHNAGVLIVYPGGRGKAQRSIGSDDIARRLESKDDSCVIM